MLPPGRRPGKIRNSSLCWISIFFLDFWMFYGRFGPREGFHRLPRTCGINSGRIWDRTDPPRPDSLPKPPFSPLLGLLFPPQISTWAKLCFSPFSPTVAFFEFVDLFHEMRHPKLVCLLSGRGPGGLWEAGYVQISFKTLSGGLFSVWSPERFLYFQNITNYMVSFKSCVPDAMPAGAFWKQKRKQKALSK